MIFGHGDFHMVISKVQGELTAPKELLILPTFVVGVNHHAREKLRDSVDIIVFFFEVFISAPATVFHAVVDVVIPRDVKNKVAPRLDGFGQINSHHRVVDRIRQGTPSLVPHVFNLESTVKRGFQSHDLAKTFPVAQIGFTDFVAIAIQGTYILIQLHPDVAQFVWAVVDVKNAFFAINALIHIVQGDLDVVIGLLLPIFMARCTRGGPINIGGGQFLAQLPKLIVIGLRGNILQGLLRQ